MPADRRNQGTYGRRVAGSLWYLHSPSTWIDFLLVENGLEPVSFEYKSLQRYDTAIETGLSHLLDRLGDRATIYNHLGISYFLKGETAQAAHHFQLAIELQPEDTEIQRNLDRALKALGRSPATKVAVADSAAGGPRAVFSALDVDSFYWLE